jgi:hypothetical protein
VSGAGLALELRDEVGMRLAPFGLTVPFWLPGQGAVEVHESASGNHRHSSHPRRTALAVGQEGELVSLELLEIHGASSLVGCHLLFQ